MSASSHETTIQELMNDGHTFEEASLALEISTNQDNKMEDVLEDILIEIEESDKELLLKICENILNHLEQTKFRSLNYGKLCKKFISPEVAIKFLYCAGFVRSNENNSRLTLNESNIETLQTHAYLLLYNRNKCIISNMVNVMRESNILADEAESIVLMSFDSTQKINDNMDIEEAVAYLTNIGFKRDESMQKIVEAEYSIKNALNKLIYNQDKTSTNNQSKPLRFAPIFANNAPKGDCSAGIGFCENLKNLKELLNKYNSKSDSNINITLVLDSFHHLLKDHNSNEEFEEIYHVLGKCDANKCRMMRRIYRQRDKPRNIESDEKTNGRSCIADIFCKIHCFFLHSYDVGQRLTPNERKQIERSISSVDNENYEETDTFNHKLLTTHKIIASKQKIIASKKSLNKFNIMKVWSSNLKFSVGERYYYWPYFEKNEWYIRPHFSSLREELIENPVAALLLDQYKNEYNKAYAHKESKYGKTLIAFTDEKYLVPPFQWFHDITFEFAEIIFGIKSESQVGINHLLAALVYCNYSHLSFEFSKTFRRLQGNDKSDDDWKAYMLPREYKEQWRHRTGVEMDASIKGRHCKFYHIAKHLNELIYAFNLPSMIVDEGTQNFYHGISKKMYFGATRDSIYHPFSTTGTYEVAISFSGDVGMILSLNCDTYSRYFKCSLISDFPAENELLFINCTPAFKFTNIVDTKTGNEYEPYIKALAIIDCALIGQPFEPNNEVDTKVLRMRTPFVKELGAKAIHPQLKILTIKMIKHELHRYNPRKYCRFKNIDPYIDNLLHYICLTQPVIFIDWKLMGLEINERYECGGYNGFYFLKSLFCHKKWEMIDFDLMSLLFPNASGIHIRKYTERSVNVFDYIVEFLRKGQLKNLQGFLIDCLFSPESLKKYKSELDKIGWILSVTVDDNISKVKIVRKIQEGRNILLYN